MLRTIIVILWTIICTGAMAAAVIFTAVFTKNGNATHLIGRIWGLMILIVSGIRVTVQGQSNLPSGPCIYMSNHASFFDIPVLFAHLKAQYRWLAKEELFKIPIFGKAMERSGAISIDRTNRKSAFRSLKKAAEMIKNGTSVIIFPEGTRSPDGHIQPFKKGGFFLAVDAGVPLVPVVIHGTNTIMPKKKLNITSGCVVLEILPPIDTTAHNRKTKDDLLQNVYHEMNQAFYRTGKDIKGTVTHS